MHFTFDFLLVAFYFPFTLYLSALKCRFNAMNVKQNSLPLTGIVLRFPYPTDILSISILSKYFVSIVLICLHSSRNAVHIHFELQVAKEISISY